MGPMALLTLLTQVLRSVSANKRKSGVPRVQDGRDGCGAQVSDSGFKFDPAGDVHLASNKIPNLEG